MTLKSEQEKALEDYSNGKMSFERLAEELGINFYALHTAFRRFAKTQKSIDKKLLIKLVMKAYKAGREDGERGCNKDSSFFEKLVESELAGAEELDNMSKAIQKLGLIIRTFNGMLANHETDESIVGALDALFDDPLFEATLTAITKPATKGD